MSIHDEMDALADVYAGGGLDAAERLEVERHAAGCGACAAALRDAGDFATWLRGTVAPDAPPAGLEDRIVGGLWKSSALPRRRWRLLPGPRVLWILKGLAAAVLLVVLGHLFSERVYQDSVRASLVDSAFTNANLTGYVGGDSDRVVDELFNSSWNGYLSFGRTVTDASRPPSPSDTASGSQAFLAFKGPVNINTAPTVFLAKTVGDLPPKAQYDRDVNQLREYASALERDNAQLRPVKDAYERLKAARDFSTESATLSEAQKEMVKANIERTKLAAGQDVLARQAEVQLGQAQERLEESRNKLAKAVAEKPVGIAELKDERQESERLHHNLAKLEKKHVEVSGENKLLEERVSHLSVTGFAGVRVQDFSGLPPEAIPVSFQDSRKVIRNARVDLEVESYAAAHRKIAEIVAAEKGFIAGADTERLPNNKVKAVVTLRVPPERFEAALARLGELGTVRHQSVASQDVTKAYVDLEARMGSKQALVDRLKKVLAEAKGNAKELMEVEVQMGRTIEEIESIKGELKYYDSQVALSTIVLNVAEKDLGQPFEYVQTLQSTIGLTVRDPDDAYARAQKAIADAGGQVVDSKMSRQNDGSAQATVKGRVDAEKFPAVREELRKLGHVDNDTVDQQKTARGGSADAPRPDAPLRREQATIDLTLSTPPILVTRRAQVTVEAAAVKDVYESARKAVEAAGGRIAAGSLSGQAERMGAVVRAQVDAEKFAGLVDQLKALGKVKNAGVSIELPAQAAGGTARPIVERGDLEFAVLSPPSLIPEEKGLGKAIRDTFSGSVAGLLWSVEKLFVGICLAGPWLVVPAVVWIVWRRRRRAKTA